ncbi:MAG: DNA mismatch repair endonuclease MutL [Calditrichaeota bacterium]|nr:DNA mismatch repair endonuclease MutL [Calditrichota bacterium]
MDLIKLLPDALANKIAAGEVVERPASVVKELVENSLDAGSGQITIVLKNAGKSLIQVIDTGRGMSESDAKMAFERHATSKISRFEDLDSIATMGFRGEALPSIAAVAQVELVTKQADDKLATKIVIQGSQISDESKTAAETGTSVSVKNLFFNVPARKNFLKTDATESNHIITMLKKFFLAHPDVHFKLYSEDKLIYDLKKSSLEHRIREVLGNNFFSGMLAIDEEISGMQLNGYILKPDLARHSKGMQFLFINQRLVNSKYLNFAIQNAYGHKIERNQYPGFCLYLNLDPSLIDINVHPSKMEVRFTNERMLFNVFQSAVKKALNVVDVVPQMAGYDPSHGTTSTAPANGHRDPKIININDLRYVPPQTFGTASRKQRQFVPNQATIPLNFVQKDSPVDDRLSTTRIEPSDKSAEYGKDQALWQLHNRYILSQIKSGLVLIDQHVAHERILYEKILKTLKNNTQYHSQQLLFPQTVELSPEDFEYYKEIEEMLIRVGYSVKAFSGTTVVIEAIPGDIRIGNEAKSLMEIIDFHKENVGKRPDPIDKMAAAYACRNAIKSGEKLNQNEMQSLVDQLFATSSPYFCPHGRPVIVTIDLYELDKKFKRV